MKIAAMIMKLMKMITRNLLPYLIIIITNLTTKASLLLKPKSWKRFQRAI